METVSCPACGNSLSEQALFCTSCARQVRCKACHALLLVNARACERCGTLVGQGAADRAVNVGEPASLAVNTLEFQETEKRRSVKVRFTDTAVANMSGTIGLLMGAGARALRERPGPMSAAHLIDMQQLALPEPAVMAHEDVLSIEVPATSAAPIVITPVAPGSDRERVQRVFRRDGERLKLVDSRLKASGVLDFAQRLTLLFLYAHDQEGREMVPRAELNVILTEASLNDGNTRVWLAKTQDIITDSDQIGLSIPGRERAQTVLAETLDPNVPNKWLLSSRSQGRSVRKPAEDKGEGTKTSNRKRGRTPLAEKWLAAWKALALPVNGHDAIKNRSHLDKGIVGLWAIRRATKEEAKVVGVQSLAKFLLEVFEVKVAHRTLENALSSDAAKDKVIALQGTSFQINQTGMQYAEGVVGLGSTAPASVNGAVPATSASA